MKKKIFISVLIISLTLCLVSVSLAGNAPNVTFRDIRAMGMGGAGVATMEGFNALMYNPALLGKADFGLELINIQANMSKDVFDLIDFIDDNQDALDNFTDLTLAEQEQLLRDMDKFDNNSIGAGVMPKVGLVMSNFAVGVYATGEVDFKIDKGIFDPKIFAYGHLDIVYSAGYGSKLPLGIISFLPNDLYYGVDLKIIRRSFANYKSSATDLEFDNVIDSLEENETTGFGLDFGLLYEMMPGKLTLGAKVNDFLSDIGDDKMPMIVNVGAAYKFSENLLFAADYNDFFMHKSASLFNRLYFGAELHLGHILMARGGFAQGYPSIGAGLSFGALAFDGAIYGIEKSNNPGGDGDYNYAVRIKIGM